MDPCESLLNDPVTPGAWPQPQPHMPVRVQASAPPESMICVYAALSLPLHLALRRPTASNCKFAAPWVTPLCRTVVCLLLDVHHKVRLLAPRGIVLVPPLGGGGVLQALGNYVRVPGCGGGRDLSITVQYDRRAWGEARWRARQGLLLSVAYRQHVTQGPCVYQQGPFLDAHVRASAPI